MSTTLDNKLHAVSLKLSIPFCTCVRVCGGGGLPVRACVRVYMSVVAHLYIYVFVFE